MDAQDTVSLATLLRGGAIERFDDELQRVLENILDPNTDDGKRSVTLTVTLDPSENRQSASVDVKCSSKVQGARPVDTTIFFAQRHGRAVAVEHNPDQLAMAFAQQTPVVPLKTAEGGK